MNFLFSNYSQSSKFASKHFVVGHVCGLKLGIFRILSERQIVVSKRSQVVLERVSDLYTYD